VAECKSKWRGPLEENDTPALSLIAKGSRVDVCGSCMDARGIKPESPLQGAKRSSMDELAGWT
jgi:uncharacterized protein involved in oxidation of intracellular sulfur